MSTLTGHSLLHALQARQKSSASLDRLGPPAVGNVLALGHLEQEAGAAARGIGFLAGRAVARAHHAGIVLAAFADADAARGDAGEVPPSSG